MGRHGRLLIVALPGDGGDEYVLASEIESIRPTRIGRHASDAKSLVRTTSGREIAVINPFNLLVDDWKYILDEDRNNET